MQRLGVFGGTFDPIHEGHLAIARQAKAAAGLDQVLILPMAHPAHREPAAPFAARMAMCRLAVGHEPGLTVSDAGASARFTSDTIPLLRRAYPGAAFTLILGADKLPSLPYWHDAARLFAACDMLCFPRAGVDTAPAMQKAQAAGARLKLLPGVQLPFSSTLIRTLSEKYEDAPGVSLPVLCYMAENGLYQPNLLPRLRTMMNPHRFKHTLGVRSEAVRLAALHGLAVQKAALAGLLHDCAKGMPLPQMVQLSRENNLVSDPALLSSGAMLHGPVGAYVAQVQFGVQDADVLAAIRNHTIGRPGMSGLELCVFVADATGLRGPGGDSVSGGSIAGGSGAEIADADSGVSGIPGKAVFPHCQKNGGISGSAFIAPGESLAGADPITLSFIPHRPSEKEKQHGTTIEPGPAHCPASL